ncbi:MAG: hypothetical protein LH613_17905 [Chamaesiphon sp.]|nr:hypothetical protein [Chamaesiphon sp.]
MRRSNFPRPPPDRDILAATLLEREFRLLVVFKLPIQRSDRVFMADLLLSIASLR